MKNYELNYDEIKEIGRVTSQLKVLEGGFRSDAQPVEQSTDKMDKQLSMEKDKFFYEINNNKAILKMDVVKTYLGKIKDKSWDELKSMNTAAWIMAVQIALRSTQIWWETHDRYWRIVIDGLLWSDTMEAVKKFQKDNNLKVDGLPGSETLNRICDILDWQWVGNALRKTHENSKLKESKNQKERWFTSLSHDDFKKYFEWEKFQQANIGDCWILAAIDSLVSFWDYEKLIRKSVLKNDNGFMVRLPLWSWLDYSESKSYFISFDELNQTQRSIDWNQAVLVQWKDWIKALLLAYWRRVTWKKEFDFQDLNWWLSYKAFNDLVYWMHVYSVNRSILNKIYTEESDPDWIKDKDFVNKLKNVLRSFDTKNDMLTLSVNQLTERSGNRQDQSNDNYSRLWHYSWVNHSISVEKVRNEWWNLIVTVSNPWNSERSYDISFSKLLRSCWGFSLCTKVERKWMNESKWSFKWKRKDALSGVDSSRDVESVNQDVQLRWSADKALREARWDIVVTGNDVLTVSSFGLKAQVKEENWKIIVMTGNKALSIDKKYLSSVYEYDWKVVSNDAYPLCLYWVKIANFINRMRHDYITPKKWANNRPFSFWSKWCLYFNESSSSSVWGFLRSLYRWDETLTILKNNWDLSLWIISDTVKKDLANFLNDLYCIA